MLRTTITIAAALWLAAAVLPAGAATDAPANDTLPKQFEAMQQTMDRMQATQDPVQLNALMHQHMTEMMAGMQAMRGTMGGGMMGGGMGMMGHSQSGGMMGEGQQTPPMTPDAQVMQQRMSMMWMMMNQMMQHMQEQQRLDQQK
jgi:periplasmic protein CpxP/Spy